MAARFWVGGTANWDASTTTNWAATSGGVGGASVPTSSDDVTFDTLSNATAYTVTITATANCNNLTIGNPLSGVVTCTGGNTLNVAGNLSTATGVLATYFGNLTLTATTGTKTITSNSVKWSGSLVLNGSGGTFQLVDMFELNRNLTLTAGIFDPNGQTVKMNGAVTNQTITGNWTFFNLTKAPSIPDTKDLLVLANNITITNLFTIDEGATVTNRVLIQSSVVGTPRTITSASNSFNNADFIDITAAGAASWNLSAITGLSGDCGGNTGITFTTPVTQHWTNASSGNWSASGNWTSRVPLPQDNVVMDKAFGTSQTVTANMPRLGASIDWTGATWTTALTFASGTNSSSVFGSYTLISGLTYGSNINSLTLRGRGNFTITGNGVTINQGITINAPTATYTLGSDIILSSSGVISVQMGTLTVVNGGNNYVISAGSLGVNNTSGVLTLGSSTHLLTGDSTTVGSVMNNATGATINAGTSTLKITNISNNSVILALGNYTFNNLWFSRGASTGTHGISGNNTFNDIKDDGSAAHTLQFAAGSTTTVSTFTVSGSSGNAITLNSSTTATFALVKTGGGVIACDWLNIQHSVATPSSTWYAGYNSVNNQAVATAGSGWIFLQLFLPANVGTFTLTGFTSTFTRAWKSLSPTVGSFTLTGITAAITSARRIVNTFGSFTLTGEASTLTSARKSVLNFGSFVLTAFNSIFKFDGSSTVWTRQTKSSVPTYTNQTKNSTSWTTQTKS